MIPRGAWHQIGHESAPIAADVFPQPGGGGVGAIFSPKDGAFELSKDYASRFRGMGKAVMWDPQFFKPGFLNRHSATYPIQPYRAALAKAGNLTDPEKSHLARTLEVINRELGSVAVIAPAVCMEASQPALIDVNEMLFNIAKLVGESIGIPTLASIPIGASASGSEIEIRQIIQAVSSWNASGWYHLFDFGGIAVPVEPPRLRNWAKTSLTLAGTGKPLIQGYQGLLSVAAVGLGAHAVALGHSQTLWHFDPNHWRPNPHGIKRQGVKFFSVPLWHHLRWPDDFTNLPTPFGDPFISPSPWSATPQSRRTSASWRQYQARRHFMFITTQWIDSAFARATSRQKVAFSKAHLDSATANWAALKALRYATPKGLPHPVWSDLLDWVLKNHSADFDWLELISV